MRELDPSYPRPTFGGIGTGVDVNGAGLFGVLTIVANKQVCVLNYGSTRPRLRMRFPSAAT